MGDVEYLEHYMWCVHPDKTKTFGSLLLPRGTEDCQVDIAWPTMVLGHGIGGDHSHMDPFARAVAATGACTYNIDFRAGGPTSKSDLDMVEMSVEGEADDLAYAADLMLEEHFCADDALFLCGGSMGGLAAMVEACRRPELYRALVLVYPAFNMHDEAVAAWGGLDELPETAELFAGAEVGRPYMRDVLGCDPFDLMAAYDRPVLIVHGTADDVVPLGYSERAAAMFPNARLVEIPGAGHAFGGEALARACDAVAGFVRDVVAGEKR